MKHQYALIFESKEEMDDLLALIDKLKSKPKNQTNLTNSKICKNCGKEIDERYDYCYPCYQKKDQGASP